MRERENTKENTSDDVTGMRYMVYGGGERQRERELVLEIKEPLVAAEMRAVRGHAAHLVSLILVLLV